MRATARAIAPATAPASTTRATARASTAIATRPATPHAIATPRATAPATAHACRRSEVLGIGDWRLCVPSRLTAGGSAASPGMQISIDMIGIISYTFGKKRGITNGEHQDRYFDSKAAL